MGAVRGVLLLDIALGKRLQKYSHLQGMPIYPENKQSHSLLVLALATGRLWSRQLSKLPS